MIDIYCTYIKIVRGRHLLSYTQQDAVALSRKAHQFAAGQSGCSRF